MFRAIRLMGSFRIIAGLVGCMWICPITLGAEFRVCSPSLDEFIEYAYPPNVVSKASGRKLLKYAHPPELIVLVPEQRVGLKGESERVFTRIEGDIGRPVDASIHTFGTYDQARAVVEKNGGYGIVVVVADPVTSSFKRDELISILTRVLGSAVRADQLVSRSEDNPGFVTSNSMNLLTGEVVSTAYVLNPKFDDAKIGSEIYLAYFSALSPSASSVGVEFFRRFFDVSPDIALSQFGRDYFRTFSDERVHFGMQPTDFIPCDAP